MPILSRVSSFCRNLLRRGRAERDLDDEVSAAFDLLVEENVQAGMEPRAARRVASLQLGHVETVKEQVRNARAGALADAFLWDTRYAARLLRNNPLVTITQRCRSQLASAHQPPSSASPTVSCSERPPEWPIPTSSLRLFAPNMADSPLVFRLPLIPTTWRSVSGRRRCLACTATTSAPPSWPRRCRERRGARVCGRRHDEFTSRCVVQPAAGRLFGAGDSERRAPARLS